jgi:uncharacterized membrane protein
VASRLGIPIVLLGLPAQEALHLPLAAALSNTVVGLSVLFQPSGKALLLLLEFWLFGGTGV